MCKQMMQIFQFFVKVVKCKLYDLMKHTCRFLNNVCCTFPKQQPFLCVSLKLRIISVCGAGGTGWFSFFHNLNFGTCIYMCVKLHDIWTSIMQNVYWERTIDFKNLATLPHSWFICHKNVSIVRLESNT